MYCENCGYKLASNTKYCVKCGSAVKTVKSSAATQHHDEQIQSKYIVDAQQNIELTQINDTRIKTKTKKDHHGLRKWVFGSSILLALFAWQPVSDYSAVTFSTASPSVKQASRDAGLNIHGQAIFLSNNPEFLNSTRLAYLCPHDNKVIEFGCYLPNIHKIYILEIEDTSLKPIMITTVVHEMLHAAWNDLSDEDRQTIGDGLSTLYKSGSSTTLSNDAEPYQENNSAAFVNELHSLAGAEVYMTDMSESLQNYYNKYFSDQRKPVRANISYNQNINSRIANIKSQGVQLDADLAEIHTFKSAHLDNINAAMQQSLYYGDTYSYNKNVNAYNYNLEIYNNMVAKYNINVNSYNVTRKIFVDAYSSLFPGKVIPVPDSK